MSRSEDFSTGSLEHVDPTTLHPHMNDYRIEVGNTGEYESGVGFVRTDLLAGMHGNGVTSEGVERHAKALLSGEGFTDPVMVEFDPRTRITTVGEGNHRVEAAKELGVSHVPVRVIRSRVRPERAWEKGGDVGVAVDARSEWRDGMGQPYWPPSMHPRHIFPKDTL